MRDLQKQEPFSVNQNKTERPNIKRSNNLLTGYFANSCNGGHNKVITYKQIMAGERHSAYRLKTNIQMLTPLTPAYQNLKATIRAYFVPNSRVWTNAEKFTAQKGGTSETKITEVPNLYGKLIPKYSDGDERETAAYNTAFWRDSFISSYIPRIGLLRDYADNVGSAQGPYIRLPKLNALPLRGRIAIFNDMERNKELDEEIPEYKDDTVSNAEWQNYAPTATKLQNGGKATHFTMRAKRQDSYFTDYRTELQGIEETYPPDEMSADTALINWATWESKVDMARKTAADAQRNDWDIIAEMRGSKVLTEGKVVKIAEKTFPLNYSAITQNAYNNNEEIREDFRVLGKQGAYSYTEIDMLLYSGVEFKEEGFLHIIMTVQADTCFESAYDRLMLNCTAMEQFRPELETEKKDVLYMSETTNDYATQSEADSNETKILGFKRKWSEIFKLPNVIGGDMVHEDYFDYVGTNPSLERITQYDKGKKIITNSTYQFFEKGSGRFYTVNGTEITKAYHKDYTDLMISKNQAIESEYIVASDEVFIGGQNQIFFVGVAQCVADLPVPEEVKNNYIKFGEH